MENLEKTYLQLTQAIANAARRATRTASAALLAVSKTRTADEVRAVAALGQVAFGENYVREARSKQQSLHDLTLQWHLIGHLQSNKAKEAADCFDWIESIDRLSVITELAKQRSQQLPPLNLLIQVNIDDEASKSGCAPAQIATLAAAISATANLSLRGLMAIPSPAPDNERRRSAFAAMKELFDDLARQHPSVDTLSMGMSDDFELAIAEGATLVRVGSALFGPRT